MGLFGESAVVKRLRRIVLGHERAIRKKANRADGEMSVIENKQGELERRVSNLERQQGKKLRF